MKEALICHVAAKTDAVTNAVLIIICVITIVVNAILVGVILAVSIIVGVILVDLILVTSTIILVPMALMDIIMEITYYYLYCFYSYCNIFLRE